MGDRHGPGAKLRIYEVPYLSTANVLAACTQILADAANDPSMRVVSYSGAGLESGYSVSSLMADSQTFAQLAAAGITFLTCSGTAGPIRILRLSSTGTIRRTPSGWSIRQAIPT